MVLKCQFISNARCFTLTLDAAMGYGTLVGTLIMGVHVSFKLDIHRFLHVQCTLKLAMKSLPCKMLYFLKESDS